MYSVLYVPYTLFNRLITVHRTNITVFSVYRIELTKVNLTVYTVLVVVASLGIVLGLAFLAVNIKYRHQK